MLISLRSRVYQVKETHLQTRQLKGTFTLPEGLLPNFEEIAVLYLDAVIASLIDNIGIEVVRDMRKRHTQDMAKKLAKFERTLTKEEKAISIFSKRELQKNIETIKVAKPGGFRLKKIFFIR